MRSGLKKLSVVMVTLGVIVLWQEAAPPAPTSAAHNGPWHAIERVSIPGNMEGVGGTSGFPSISADGRFVAFVSKATNLVPGDTNTCPDFTTPGSCPDVFVRDRLLARTTRVSVASDGAQSNGDSSIFQTPSISSDGRFVAFESRATNLVPGDNNNLPDVFVHDRQTGQTMRVSVASDGTQSNSGSGSPSISGDGRFIAFAHVGSFLEPLPLKLGGIFAHELQTGQTTHVSIALNGSPAAGISLDPSVSGDGRFVAFQSVANNLVPGETGFIPDIFVAERTEALPPDFGLACSPSALTILQGEAGSSNCTLASLNGFNSAIALSCAGAPAGVTCGFGANPVTPPANGTAGSLLTVLVDSLVLPGTIPFQVRGSGGGLTRNFNFTVTVVRGPAFIGPPERLPPPGR